ncbi:MAG TPA: TIGR02646 family protein [Anaerolineae bacterium]|nr:TIGR02646 family protein [Anaerolineales bacterium]HRV96158.1 TIGR02646 family protein [Anaerolineae bacterium]
MKHIIKRGQPHDLQLWFNEQPIEDGRRINCDYRSMPNDVKHIVKQQLILEQGGLCCYTGLRITAQKSHIEHFKPQSRCQNYEDVDYNNLLAAYPGNDIQNCPYGAHPKAGDELPISPLNEDSERRFHFDLDGQIAPLQETDQGAKETIRILNLCHNSLTEMRQQAIESALLQGNRKPSDAQLRRIIEGYCQRDAKQLFKPFCFVIVQAAQELLELVARERKKKQYSRSQERK